MKKQVTPWLTAIILIGLNPTVFADGESTYKEHCGSCHGGGFKGMLARAPKTGKQSAWTDYFKVSVDQSTSDVFKGTPKHKAMGKEADLSQEEIRAAVDFILSKTNISK